MPFWHGDRPGRPLELGRARRRASSASCASSPPGDGAIAMLRDDHALDELAAANLVQYLDEQAEATGVVPDDRTVVVERFRDEIGDWRVCILSPFGTPVHAPWAMAIERRLADHYDMPVESMWGDDGIVLRLPEAADELPLEAIMHRPRRHRGARRVGAAADGAVLVALPRVRRSGAAAAAPPPRPAHAAVAATPAGRRPARRRRQVPDVPDPARGVAGVPAGRVRRPGPARGPRPAAVAGGAGRHGRHGQAVADGARACCSTGSPPTCTRATRRWPSGGRRRWRSTATCSRDLLGAEELRELLDPGVLADVELDLQRLSDGRRARTADELHDVLRRVGDLSADRGRAALRAGDGHGRRTLLATLVAERRAIEVVDRRRAALHRRRGRRPLPRRPRVRPAARACPQAFTDPVPRPLEELVARYARTHGPFVERDVADRFGLAESRVAGALAALELDGRIVRGEFRPEGVRREWCDVEILRQLRRRSLAALRREVEPVEPATLAEFLPAWQGGPAPTRRGRRGAGRDGRRARRRAARGVDAGGRRARRRGSPATGRRCSTSCARRATSCGSVPGRSGRTTGASGCASPTSSPSSRRAGSASIRRPAPLHDTVRELLAARGAASGRSCGPAPSGPPTPSCSPRCGTSSGPARSPTTRWPRCGR